jgi:hypothetical protein
MATCLQGTQTNAIVAALLITAFIAFEKKLQWLAAFAIAAGFFIKIFPIVMLSFFLLYPDKMKFIVKFSIAFLLLAGVPLLFTSPAGLLWQYNNWIKVLVEDTHDNYGKISLPGFFQVFFNLSETGKLCIQFIGLLLFGSLFTNFKLFRNYSYRIYLFCGLMIWVTIFNHAAEIYSYAIAIWGVGTWFVLQPGKKYSALFICCFIVLASVISIDPTPRLISDYVFQHCLKPIPFTMIFFAILWRLWVPVRSEEAALITSGAPEIKTAPGIYHSGR